MELREIESEVREQEESSADIALEVHNHRQQAERLEAAVHALLESAAVGGQRGRTARPRPCVRSNPRDPAPARRIAGAEADDAGTQPGIADAVSSGSGKEAAGAGEAAEAAVGRNALHRSGGSGVPPVWHDGRADTRQHLTAGLGFVGPQDGAAAAGRLADLTSGGANYPETSAPMALDLGGIPSSLNPLRNKVQHEERSKSL